MRVWRGATLLLPLSLLAWSGATPAAPALLPCALPVDRPLRLVTEQASWQADGSPFSVTIVREARILQGADGLTLDSGPPLVRSTLPRAAGRRLEAGFGAGLPMRLRLAPDGGVMGIDEQGRHWAQLLGRLADPHGPGGSVRAQALRQRLEGIGAQEQRRLLAGFWLPFVRLCGQWLDEAPAGADGLVELVRADDPVPGARGETRYRVDPASGLALRIERTVTPDAAPDRPLRERWQIELVPATPPAPGLAEPPPHR